MKSLKNFTKQYSVSKTLRFELRPIGKTLENIQSSEILLKDDHRADSYQKVKKIINGYHRVFIDRVLSNLELVQENENQKNSLQEFYDLYMIPQKTDAEKTELATIQKNLRKQIASAFSEDPVFKTIGKEELIKKELPQFVTENEERLLIEEFRNFTTYFSGFHENRKNMYSEKDQSTAISHRIVHENLPKFINNMKVFKKVMGTDVREKLPILFKTFSDQGYMNVKDLADMFSLDYYNMLLTQPQIELYNAIIGGKTEQDGTKVQGINEYINLYNQKQKDKKNRLPNLKLLFKQILSNREQISWLPNSFDNDNQMLSAIHDYFQELKTENVLKNLQLLLESIADYDLDKIYLKNDQLKWISQQMFGDWGLIAKAIGMQYEIDYPRGKKKIERHKTLKEKYLTTHLFSIDFINKALSLLELETSKKVEDYFAQMGAVNTAEKQNNLFEQINESYKKIEPLLTHGYPEAKNLAQDKEAIEQIKTFLESLMRIVHFIKPLLVKEEDTAKDELFYSELLCIWDYIDQTIPLYNKVRSRLTRKPFSIEKYKINFENSTLLGGWDVNKEPDNTSVLLRKDGKYYLAIMDKKSNKVFSHDLPSSGDCYEKIDYKQFDITKQIAKCTTQLKSVVQAFNNSEISSYEIFDNKTFHTPITISREIWELNNLVWDEESNTFTKQKKDDKRPKKFQKDYLDITKDKKGYHKALLQWINFVNEFQKSYKSTSIYNITDINASNYKSLDDFYSYLNHKLYHIGFRNVSTDYINTLVEEGKIYLFQIYSKDFSDRSKGTPNIHTLYWKMLFDERNLADVVYKLNGQAEIFFRKSSLKYDRPTHPADIPIKNKNKNNKNKERTLHYDLTKDKRYTMDKFMFHVPITMNFKHSSVKKKDINPLVDEYIKSNEDLHFIGIDRGERHLLYISVVDSKGNIKWQGSLNEINSFNYRDLLTDREKKLQAERRSWQMIEGIKDLKQGYLSQVVYKISQLILQYNAIVVLEDLNMEFKRSRQKIESAVYQQFEKSLIDKLSFLVDKKRPAEADGGLLSAYQLTNPFESFQKMGKRNGFIFYIPAWNTSKIDPTTGFVNLFDTRYININKAKEFFGKFDIIRYNEAKNWFEFKFDYNNFTTKAEGTKTQWTLCTVGDRILSFRNKKKNSQWEQKEVDLTSEFKNFFEKYSIDIKGNLQEAITSQTTKGKEFYEELYQLLRLTLQMRNSISNTETDYLVSPVADNDGNFYDSRKATQSWPQDADANGAYNIALKGLWQARQIRQSKEGEKLKLTMTNKEWLKFAQQKPYLLD